MKNDSKSKRGFLMVEVLMALAVMSILIPVILLAIQKGSQTVASVEQNTNAVLLAQRVNLELEKYYRGDGDSEISLESSMHDHYFSISKGFNLSNISKEQFEEGVNDVQTQSLLKLSKIQTAKDQIPEGVEFLRLELSNPVVAPYENRQRSKFYRYYQK